MASAGRRLSVLQLVAALVCCCVAPAQETLPEELVDDGEPFFFVDEPPKPAPSEAGLGPQLGQSEYDAAVPGLLVTDALLTPEKPYAVKLEIGQVKFLRFNCMSGPADAVISLSTYSVHDDPLLFLSLDPLEAPTLSAERLSSFSQWREDSIGDHYVIAHGVAPAGGIIGIMNVKHFAGEMLDGLVSVRCSAIIGFDVLFWDHLRDSAICPLGLTSQTTGDASHEFCSGHGRCSKHGVCDCDADFTGPACWEPKDDIVVSSFGRYDFDLGTGRYRYFRVRIPRSFPGGYLDVKLGGEVPLVLLLGRNQNPTKSHYELSNFDDWINQRNESSLQFKIEKRREVSLPAPLLPLGLGPALPVSDSRRMSAGQCPLSIPKPSNPTCASPEYAACENACMHCMECKIVRSTDADGCASSCTMCTSSTCLEPLGTCAGGLNCSGNEANTCEERCGRCWGCLDSNDPNCGARCHCCRVCLPLAAKCDLLHPAASTNSSWLVVGVLNHRGRHSRHHDSVHAVAEITLKMDPLHQFGDPPRSWVADLYDPFQDLESLALARSTVYPDGQPFLYNLDVTPGKRAVRKKLRLYRDRMTLVRVTRKSRWPSRMKLAIKASGKIAHVLSSSRSSPKTMFDFEQVHTIENGFTRMHTDGERRLWCAIFGKDDGWVQISASTYRGQLSMEPPISPGAAVMFILALFGGILILGFLYSGGFGKLVASFCPESDGDSVPLTERFASMVRAASVDENTPALAGVSVDGSSHRGMTSMEIRLEDQYLHRGGFGDDGI